MAAATTPRTSPASQSKHVLHGPTGTGNRLKKAAYRSGLRGSRPIVGRRTRSRKSVHTVSLSLIVRRSSLSPSWDHQPRFQARRCPHRPPFRRMRPPCESGSGLQGSNATCRSRRSRQTAWKVLQRRSPPRGYIAFTDSIDLDRALSRDDGGTPSIESAGISPTHADGRLTRPVSQGAEARSDGPCQTALLRADQKQFRRARMVTASCVTINAA